MTKTGIFVVRETQSFELENIVVTMQRRDGELMMVFDAKAELVNARKKFGQDVCVELTNNVDGMIQFFIPGCTEEDKVIVRKFYFNPLSLWSVQLEARADFERPKETRQEYHM